MAELQWRRTVLNIVGRAEEGGGCCWRFRTALLSGSMYYIRLVSGGVTRAVGAAQTTFREGPFYDGEVVRFLPTCIHPGK